MHFVIFMINGRSVVLHRRKSRVTVGVVATLTAALFTMSEMSVRIITRTGCDGKITLNMM
jgi:hypothetical protein